MSQNNGAVGWAMRNHSVVLLITCCLIVFGVVGLMKMNKNEFPDFTIREGLIVAVYPGKTAAEVEKQLTKPLEDFTFSYKEVCKAKTKSFSQYGFCVIQIELNDDLEDNDAFWNKFKHGMNDFKSSLPTGVLAVEVNDDFADTSAMLLTLESDEKTYRELQLLMDDLEDRLRGIEEIGRMKVLGMLNEQISVYIDNAKLAHYGLSDETLSMSLFTKGFTTLSGTLRMDGYNSPIYVAPSMNLVADVENLIVYSSPTTGTTVRLRDIAEVKREYPIPSSVITNNFQKCLLLSIEMKKGRNITEMGSQIDDILHAYETTLPTGVSLNKITDQPKVVQSSVVEFLRELLIAIIAVMIVVLLLLPFRVAIIASATIPITIFIALGFFYALNIELNTVTLAALIVTLGMIVDNSIVIIDAYVDDLNHGIDRQRAAIDSAKHFFRGIFTATLAISITFFPLLITVDGMFGDFLKAFPWAITIVLAVSLVVAELLVPYLLYHFIHQPPASDEGEKETKSKRGAFDNWLQARYNSLIDKCFAYPRLTIGIGILTIVLAVCLIPSLPLRLMPTAERNQFAVEIYLPTGSSLEATTHVADSLERLLSQDKRVKSIASFKGTSSPRFQTGYAPQFPAESYAQFIVNTGSNKETEALLDEYSYLHDAFPEAFVRFKQLAYGTEENPVEVRLTGFDMDKLLHKTDEIVALMRDNPDLWLVRTDMNEPLMTTQVALDADKSGTLGTNNTGVNIALATRYLTNGIPIATIWDGDYDVSVSLKSRTSDSATVDVLGEELVPVAAGLRSVPLRSLASVSQTYEVGQIPHRNGVPTITIKADVSRGKNVTNVTSHLMKTIKKLDKDDDVTVSFGGEYESNEQNLPKLFSALSISVVIIFFLLLAHYKSVSISLLLLFSLSLTLFGTVMSVFIGQINFSVTCFLGIISLMGILVRNAIIMFDYANELLLEDNLTVRDAILMSAKRRMHPIFLTSAAASMGVIPMILSGSGLWAPMGVIICYGTLITMIFILTIMPVTFWQLKKS